MLVKLKATALPVQKIQLRAFWCAWYAIPRLAMSIRRQCQYPPLHTVVSLPYYPIHFKGKNHIKAHSKVKSRLSEMPKGASLLQTLPKVLTPGHK